MFLSPVFTRVFFFAEGGQQNSWENKPEAECGECGAAQELGGSSRNPVAACVVKNSRNTVAGPSYI